MCILHVYVYSINKYLWLGRIFFPNAHSTTSASCPEATKVFRLGVWHDPRPIDWHPVSEATPTVETFPSLSSRYTSSVPELFSPAFLLLFVTPLDPIIKRKQSVEWSEGIYLVVFQRGPWNTPSTFEKKKKRNKERKENVIIWHLFFFQALFSACGESHSGPIRYFSSSFWTVHFVLYFSHYHLPSYTLSHLHPHPSCLPSTVITLLS